MPVVLSDFRTFEELLRMGFNAPTIKLLQAQGIGLAVILTLSKFGVNQYIADRQNDLQDYFQNIQNYFGTDEKLRGFVDVVGKKMGLDDKAIESYKEKLKYTRADNYKADVGTIEIFEVSALQAFMAYGKSGNPLIAFAAFIASEMSLTGVRRYMEIKQGRDFNIARAFSTVFGNVPILSTICRWLEPEAKFEGEDGDVGFDNKVLQENFINDAVNGRVDKDIKDFETDAHAVVDIKNPVKDIDTDKLLDDEANEYGFDDEGIEKRKKIEQLKGDFNNGVKEDWQFEPVFGDEDDWHFRPFFDNAKENQEETPAPEPTPEPETPPPKTTSVYDLQPPVITPVIIHDMPEPHHKFLGIF